ncbi:unnamed protein product [Cylicostephanus goldi]|uniref:Uncharacterized protein n=1 Tax=Cylicostephanus goldi TaxID=71465 RepID=A0A3P7MVB7_CYLGO|nr:unnamed protein product [Cylicostephanus goldi]
MSEIGLEGAPIRETVIAEGSVSKGETSVLQAVVAESPKILPGVLLAEGPSGGKGETFEGGLGEGALVGEPAITKVSVSKAETSVLQEAVVADSPKILPGNIGGLAISGTTEDEIISASGTDAGAEETGVIERREASAGGADTKRAPTVLGSTVGKPATVIALVTPNGEVVTGKAGAHAIASKNNKASKKKER